MLPKYVKKLLEELYLDGPTTSHLQAALTKIQQADGLNLVKYTGGVCKILLKLSEQFRKEEQDQIDTILYILQQLFQRIRNEDIYQIQLIKIKMFLVSLNRQNTLMNQGEDERIRKIQLFLLKLENNVFYPLLQEDFYSQLESIYLEGSKCFTKQGRNQQAQSNIKKCFITLKKQAAMLADIRRSEDQKYSKVLESKGKSLEELFFLEYANKSNGDVSQTQFASSMINRYQTLFNRMGMKVNSHYLISKVNKALGNVQSQSDDDSQIQVRKQNRNQSHYQSSMKSSYVSLRRQSRLEDTKTEIEDTVNFIQNIRTKRASSHIIPRGQFGRLSLKIEDINNFRKTARYSTFQCPPISHLVKEAKNDKFTIKQISENGKSQCSKPSTTSNLTANQTPKKRIPSGAKTVKKFDMVLRKEKENRQKLILFNPFKDKQYKKEDLKLERTKSKTIAQGFMTVGVAQNQ